jgi:hypothetical protein
MAGKNEKETMKITEASYTVFLVESIEIFNIINLTGFFVNIVKISTYEICHSEPFATLED